MAKKKTTKAKTKTKTKTKAKAKAKTKTTTKAKAKAKTKTKTKTKAKTKAKAKTKRATAKPATRKAPPVILDEVLEEPLVDASTILRVKDRVARSQRDVDEDERNQFSDPSLVVEVQTEESVAQLPNLFADEARRQQARLRDRADTPPPRDGSLFGLDDSDDDSD